MRISNPKSLQQFVIAALICFSSFLHSQDSAPLFRDVTSNAKISFDHVPFITNSLNEALEGVFGTGAAWFDFDRDGDLDLYVTQGIGSNKLFRNNSDGSFSDVAKALNVDDKGHEGSAVSVADFNNDGWIDVYLANIFEDVLFRNDAGTTFVDITESAGFPIDWRASGTGSSWGDYDNDGYLDLFVTHHYSKDGSLDTQERLFHNNGDETFTEVSNLLAANAFSDLEGLAFAGIWTDYDNDGDLDIFLVEDCFGPVPSKLFRNDGGSSYDTWQFTEVGKDVGISDYCANGMGLAIGDYNRDGWMDYYQSNIGSGILFQNVDGDFINASEQTELDHNYFSHDPELMVVGWGCNFFDFDLDGWIDLFVGTGELHTYWNKQPNLLYKHDGQSLTFSDVSLGSGIIDTNQARTTVYGDYDSDGDLDLYVVNVVGDAFLYKNENENENHYLSINLIGTNSNRDGIGSKITIHTPDGVSQLFETRSGSSLGGGDQLTAHFGLGAHSFVDSIVVAWPSGEVGTIHNVDTDQAIFIKEPDKLYDSYVKIDQDKDYSPISLEYLVSQNYPNPFNSKTSINYQINSEASIKIELYDILGKKIKTLVNKAGVGPGEYTLKLSLNSSKGAPLHSGIYLIRFQIDRNTITRKIVYIE